MKVPSRLSRTQAPKRPSEGGKGGASEKEGPKVKEKKAAQQLGGTTNAVEAKADVGNAEAWGGGQGVEGESAEEAADPLWGGKTQTSAKPKQSERPQQTLNARDLFAAQAALAKSLATRQVRETLGAEVSQALPPSRTDGQDPLAALNRAQPPGVYYKEDEDGGNRGRDRDDGEAIDPELEEALEETLQLLFGVPGIHRVSPGTDEEGTPVVLIFTARGFSRPSMDRIPEEVRGFKTLLVVPYDLLPLRRLV
ncbi:MAG TPA: hypothetical protein VK013_14360 [Myxococcaceae bacterium]|nr:hypothetical protein [Myxococcaceae bacterium]